jgi:bifunctional non-homologous end joining protein LigD
MPGKDRGTTGRLEEYRRKRDFARTREPRGGTGRRGPRLAYVIQKHEASHLHYDLRLELDGVMKSWAVPKGPSLDPAVKRLAVQVEDHPIEYNGFEGTIPQGEYGGGTVMIWDQGSYRPSAQTEDPQAELRRGYRKGELGVKLSGKRLKGEWTLIRLRRGARGRPQWLLIKRNDRYARKDKDVTETYRTSAATGRTMEEIAAD